MACPVGWRCEAAERAREARGCVRVCVCVRAMRQSVKIRWREIRIGWEIPLRHAVAQPRPHRHVDAVETSTLRPSPLRSRRPRLLFWPGRVAAIRRPPSRRLRRLLSRAPRRRNNSPRSPILCFSTMVSRLALPPIFPFLRPAADAPWKLDKLVGLAMLVAASVIFLYYNVWTLLMVRLAPDPPF